jgi:transposase InsO family protein
MDLGFIRGPSQQDTLNNKTTIKTTLQQSHHGYTAYLLIIDAATRYVFCFPLKNRHPPIQIIDQFLSKFGKAKKPSIITTNPDGLLNKYGYNTNTNDLYDINPFGMAELGLEQPRYTIRTDNGTELAGSQEIRNVANKHGYSVEATAPDASSQNGMAERPHRTLKEKVCCLLYTAGLGTPFWSDALLHAVWLYNRTYHSAIGMTPYQQWSGRIPSLDNLLTFGSRIISKKAKNRTTALDPNAFEGIFLGYDSTMENIEYWDSKAHLKRAAKQSTADEVQYGDPATQCSPTSKFLIEITPGAPLDQQRTDILLEPPREIDSTKNNDPLPSIHSPTFLITHHQQQPPVQRLALNDHRRTSYKDNYKY